MAKFLNETAPPSDGVTVSPPEPRWKAIGRTGAWTALGVAALLFFTLLKLPEDRLRNYVEGNLNAYLSTRGMSLSAAQNYISVGWGISYVMKDVKITLPDAGAPPLVIDKIVGSPSLLSLLIRRLGGDLSIWVGDGRLDFSGTAQGNHLRASFRAKNFDLGKSGFLLAGLNVRGSGFLNASGTLDGDLNIPSDLTGSLQAELTKIVIDAQSVMGFAVPRLAISEWKVDAAAEKAKAVVRKFTIGKSESDDLRGNLTGDILLGRQWETSTLNLKANFNLSANVLRAFSLVEMLLAGAKQADGSYAYTITGSLGAPFPTPVAAAGTPPAPAPKGR